MAALRQLEASDPDYFSVHKYLAKFAFQAGDDVTFLRESEAGATLIHDEALQAVAKAARAGYRKNGRQGMVEAIYETEKKFYAEGRIEPIEMALGSLHAGRKDEAIAHLREAWERHDPTFIEIYKRADELEGLKGYPGFAELAGKLARISHRRIADCGDDG